MFTNFKKCNTISIYDKKNDIILYSFGKYQKSGN